MIGSRTMRARSVGRGIGGNVTARWEQMRSRQNLTHSIAALSATLAGVSVTVLSAILPAYGSQATDAEFGQVATQCIKFEDRKEFGSTRRYMRNTCNKRITVFWCEPEGSSRVTRCGVGGNWPGGDSRGIGHPIHNKNLYYAQGVPIPPSESRLLSTRKAYNFGACVGGRFMAEWFSSDRNGRYRCYPRSPGAQRSQEKDAVRYAQELLNELGYNPGPADGILGRKTRAAVKRFQSYSGQERDGHISGALVAKLHAAVDARKRASTRTRPKKKAQSTSKETPANIRSKQGSDLWGSISFSQHADGSHRWAIVWNSQGARRARDLGLNLCRREGGTSCREVGWFRNVCGRPPGWQARL